LRSPDSAILLLKSYSAARSIIKNSWLQSDAKVQRGALSDPEPWLQPWWTILCNHGRTWTT
jgi:hypothetical protein